MAQNNILVPVSFSGQSIIALGQSYNIAKQTDSIITLLHVDDGTIKDAGSKLAKLAEEASSKSGIKVGTILEKGNVFKQIIKTSKKMDPLFIIMGFNSSSKIRNIGYNAFRILQDSPCPVITIKGKKHRDGCKNIVLPLDLTRETREKVNKAIEIAKLFHSDIRVISVRLKKERRHENKLISYSHQVKNFIKENKVHCTIKTLEGDDIAQLVMNYAHEVEADLIMIMTQQELNFKELFVGTTAQRLVNLSDIPVLSIRPVRRGYRMGG